MGGLKRVARRFDDWLSAIDWRDFERLLAEHYRQAGFVVHACSTERAWWRTKLAGSPLSLATTLLGGLLAWHLRGTPCLIATSAALT